MEPILLTTEQGKHKRLDAFLAESVEGVSRAAAAKLIESGAVLLDGKAPSKSYQLTGAETVEVTLPEPEPIDAVPQVTKMSAMLNTGKWMNSVAIMSTT